MQANGGTIFLDEIGETSSTMQAKLLRVLQEKEIQRVGSDDTLSVDVRIIAATNQNLEKNAAAGAFREDLFYRLNVVTLTVPPLRDRRDDVPLLAQHFLERYADKNRKVVKGFSPQAMDMLVKYDWPGNVRELENAIERAVILLAGDYITAKEMPLSISRTSSADAPERPLSAFPALNRPLDEIEREAILTAYKACGRNKSETARQLGITRKTLHKKLKTYGAD